MERIIESSISERKDKVFMTLQTIVLKLTKSEYEDIINTLNIKTANIRRENKMKIIQECNKRLGIKEAITDSDIWIIDSKNEVQLHYIAISIIGNAVLENMKKGRGYILKRIDDNGNIEHMEEIPYFTTALTSI